METISVYKSKKKKKQDWKNSKYLSFMVLKDIFKKQHMKLWTTEPQMVKHHD